MPDLCFKCRMPISWDGACHHCSYRFQLIEKHGCQVSYPDILRDLAVAADRAAFELKEARAERELALSRMRSAEARFSKAGGDYDAAKDALIGHLDASAKSNK